MKFISCTVTYEGFKKEGWNKKRLEVAGLALEKAKKLDADVLILPAGFFTTNTSEVREDIALSLIDMAKRLTFAIVFGVDEEIKNYSKNWELEIRIGKLPWYGYAWSPTENTEHCWRQRSFTSENQRWAPDKYCNEVRLLRISNDELIGILICGEIFNERIRNALAKYYPRPTVVADIAHYSQGFRVHAGMKVLANKYGLASVCSVHTQRPYAQKYCYIPQKEAVSSRNVDGWISGPPKNRTEIMGFLNVSTARLTSVWQLPSFANPPFCHSIGT